LRIARDKQNIFVYFAKSLFNYIAFIINYQIELIRVINFSRVGLT